MPSLVPGATENEMSCNTGRPGSYPNVTSSKEIAPAARRAGSGFGGSATSGSWSSTKSARSALARDSWSVVTLCAIVLIGWYSMAR